MFVSETLREHIMAVNWCRKFAMTFTTFLSEVCRGFFFTFYRDFCTCLICSNYILNESWNSKLIRSARYIDSDLLRDSKLNCYRACLPFAD